MMGFCTSCISRRILHINSFRRSYILFRYLFGRLPLLWTSKRRQTYRMPRSVRERGTSKCITKCSQNYEYLQPHKLCGRIQRHPWCGILFSQEGYSKLSSSFQAISILCSRLLPPKRRFLPAASQNQPVLKPVLSFLHVAASPLPFLRACLRVSCFSTPFATGTQPVGR